MANGGKTELQREILLTWYDNPNATNKEIPEACDCSASYVSTVKNRFNDYNQFEAMMDRQDKEMEQMFGEEIFASGAAPVNQSVSGDQPGLAEMWEDIPNNPAGIIIKAIVSMVLLFAAYQIAITLI
jgi:hypothetical protein